MGNWVVKLDSFHATSKFSVLQQLCAQPQELMQYDQKVIVQTSEILNEI